MIHLLLMYQVRPLIETFLSVIHAPEKAATKHSLVVTTGTDTKSVYTAPGKVVECPHCGQLFNRTESRDRHISTGVCDKKQRKKREVGNVVDRLYLTKPSIGSVA